MLQGLKTPNKHVVQEQKVSPHSLATSFFLTQLNDITATNGDKIQTQDRHVRPTADTAGMESGSWLEVATEVINNHLQAFRAIPLVMGIAGAVMVVRYSRMV